MSYWARKLVGEGCEARLPVQWIENLEPGACDDVTVVLLKPMNMEPFIGDETLDGKEQQLNSYTDRMRAVQVRRCGPGLALDQKAHPPPKVIRADVRQALAVGGDLNWGRLSP